MNRVVRCMCLVALWPLVHCLAGCSQKYAKGELTPAEEARIAEAYAIDEIVEMIKDNTSFEEILPWVDTRCISFEMNPSNENVLRDAGADSQLVAGLKRTCVMTSNRMLDRIGEVATGTAASRAAQEEGSAWTRQAPEVGYVSLGLGGNLYTIGSSDMDAIMSPLELSPVHFGYSFSLGAGVRNIAQIEYRWGRDKSKFSYDEFGSDFQLERTQVPVTFRHAGWIVKFNPLFGVTKMREYALFVLYGRGSVECVDDVGDGFKEGERTVYGLEFAKITRVLYLSGSIEHHAATFDRFAIEGFGFLEKPFDASGLQFNVKIGVGYGQ